MPFIFYHSTFIITKTYINFYLLLLSFYSIKLEGGDCELFIFMFPVLRSASSYNEGIDFKLLE